MPVSYTHLEYGNDKNAKSGSMAMMPTRYLLELYNENIDARYNAWFREEYKLNTPKAYAWTCLLYTS